MKVNLLEGDFMCCGSLCPKVTAQSHLDHMYRILEQAHQHINYGGLPEDEVELLKKSLFELFS